MKDSVRNLIVCCLTAGLFLLRSATASAATRVALLGGEGTPQIENVVDLAQVRLGNEPDLELLDRAHIRRILEEQKLSLSGVVAAGEAITVGKLLAVDLIAVIDSPSGKDAVPGIVVFDSRTGVRYWDAALPAAPSELESAADAVVSAVRSAQRKRDGRANSCRTVGIMTVRNADLPRSQDSLCETAGLLVERGLCRSPDVAVLERRRLTHVNEERALPVVDPPKDLLASLTTIDLEISRGDDGRGLKATALLKVAGKENAESVTVTAPESNAMSLAEALLPRLIENLRAAPASMGDSKQEARRFDAEAVHHYSHKRYGDAVRATEAAWALDPTNEDVGERLCLYLVRYATYLFWPERLNVASITGERAWMDAQVEDAVLEALLTDASRALDIHARLTRPSVNRLTFNQPLGYLGHRLRGLHNASDSPRKERIAEVLEACRQRSLLHIDRLAAAAVADPNQLDNYGLYLLQELGVLRSCSIDTEQYARVMSQIIDRWLAVTRDWQPQFNKFDGSAGLNMLLSHFVGPNVWTDPFDEQVFARQMASQHAAMRKHVRPIVQLFGLLAQLRGDVLLGTISEEEGYRRFGNEFRRLAEEIVTSPEPWDAQRARYGVYESWADLIDMMPGKARVEFVEREATAFCEFMLARFELHGKVFGKGVNSASSRKRVELYERGLLVIDSPRFSAPPETKTRLKNEYQASLQEWLRKNPELATTSSRPWSKANKVFDIGRFRQLLELDGLTVLKDDAFLLATQLEGQHREFQLLRVPLSGGDASLLAKTDLKLSPANPATFFATRFVTSMCVESELLYVATDGAGIVIFPLGTGSPSRIGVDEGLPTNNIRSVAVMDGKVYAGVGEGYLIAYDLAQKRCDVLASSRRKQKVSPFDDRKPFRVPMLIADPARKRLVFVIDEHLWQLTPADGRFTQLLNIVAVDQGRSGPKLTSDNIICTSPLRGDRVLISDMIRTMQFDLSCDQAQVLHSPDFGVFTMTSTQLVIDGFLWSGSPFARLKLDKHEYTKLPPPDNGPENFYPHIGLEPLANGRQILVADSRTVWRLELEAERPTSDSSGGAGSPTTKLDIPTVTPAKSTPAAPIQKGVVKAFVQTEDKVPLDPLKCMIQFQSFRNPSVRNGETVYGNSSGLGCTLRAGLASVEMPPGMISLGILVPGYAPVAIGLRELKADETLDLGTITLHRGIDWKFTIRNDDNRTVANAEVTAVCRFNRVGTNAVSNTDGDVLLPNAAEEEYTLSIRAPGHQPMGNIKVRASASQAAAIRVLRAQPTSGRVVDENGQPVRGARLLTPAVSPDNVSPSVRELATTDTEGRFVLDQLADNQRHQIGVVVDGKTRLGLTDVVSGKTDLEWKLKPQIRLSGKVVGLGANDVRRMRYTQSVVDEFGRVAGSFFSGETSLDAEGRFQINDLIPGVIRIEGFRKFLEVDLPKTNDDYVLDLTAPIPARTALPTITNTPSKPVSSAFPSRPTCIVRAIITTEDNAAPNEVRSTVWVTSHGSPFTINGKTQYGSSSGGPASVANGLLSAQSDPGMIALGISTRGYAPAAIGLKPAKADEIVDFGTIILKRGFTWKLAVRNEDNQPVANAEIAGLFRFANAPTKATSNSEGEVQWEHAAEDDYTFTARAPGHQPLRGLTLRATPGETATISMRRSHPTSGRVVDENDQPVAGARIKLLRDQLESFYPIARDVTKTDADGAFTLDQLADKQLHTLRVDVDDKPRLVLTNVEAGKSDQVWKLQPSLSLSGRIVGMEAGGERNLRYDQHCLDHNGTVSGSFFSGATRVSADGTFKIEGLLPGRVRLAGFRRYTDVELPESRDDYVLDLNAPDPTKPNVKVKLEFVHDGKPFPLTGSLQGRVSQTQERRFGSWNQTLKSQSAIDIPVFAPGKVQLTPDGIVGTDYCMGLQEFEVSPGQTTVTIEMLPAGSISGILRDKDGKPVADAVVSATAIVNKLEIKVPTARSNDKGEFVIAPVPLNVATTVVALSGLLTGRSEAVTLNPGEPPPKLHLRVLP